MAHRLSIKQKKLRKSCHFYKHLFFPSRTYFLTAYCHCNIQTDLPGVTECARSESAGTPIIC